MKSGMFLLVDTADRIALVGVYEEDRVIAERRSRESAPSLGWTTRAVSELLAESKLAVSDLKFLAAGIGPGGFTSVRVGLSFVKSMSQALGLPVVGVNRLEAAAMGENLLSPGSSRYFVRLPAARNLEYVAQYRIPPDGLPEEERIPEAISANDAGLLEIPKDVRRVGVNPAGLYAGIPRVAHLKAVAGRTEPGESIQPLYLRGATLGSPRNFAGPIAKQKRVRYHNPL